MVGKNKMLKIILGTQNEHKVYEMNMISKPFGVEFEMVKGNFNPIEDGKTFEENAYIKAWAAYKAHSNFLKQYAKDGIYGSINDECEAPIFFLADDSGLCVDFLNGAPGLKSARYADTTEHRIEKLLGAMKSAKNRTAHFECHLALLNNEGEMLQTTKGICGGKISYEKKGLGGFGYDPVFVLDKIQKTMAELTEDEKNLHSHRGKALRDMLLWLKKLLLQ